MKTIITIIALTHLVGCGTPFYSTTEKDWLDYLGSATAKALQESSRANMYRPQPIAPQQPWLLYQQQQQHITCYKYGNVYNCYYQ